jgi:hypothetical protein
LNGQVEPHPATQEPVRCDGILDVKSRFLTQKDSSGKTIEGQDSFSIVSYLIHKDRYGEMGIVYLPGRGVDEDEAYKAHSRDQYLKFRERVDDKIVQRRREFKANWTRNPAHQGQPAPPPTEVENAAIERSELREHKAAYDYQCEVEDCVGYATHDFTKFARHMWAAHKVQVIRSKTGEITLKNQAGDVVKMAGAVRATSGVGQPVNPEAVEVGGEPGPVPESGSEVRSGIAAASAKLGRAAPGRKKARG